MYSTFSNLNLAEFVIDNAWYKQRYIIFKVKRWHCLIIMSPMRKYWVEAVLMKQRSRVAML